MYEKNYGESYSFHHQITLEQIIGDKTLLSGQWQSNPLRSERIVIVAWQKSLSPTIFVNTFPYLCTFKLIHKKL